MAADPRVPRDHAAREPDRLGPRAHDLRGRSRPVGVPRQRAGLAGRAGEAPVRAGRRVRARRTSRSSGRSCSTSRRSSTRRGSLVAARRRSTSRGRASGLNVRAVGEAPASADAMGINVTLYRYVARRSSAARSPASAAPASASRSRRSGSGDALVGGAGWIAIALVIFAFWRAELCLVGAYLFGALPALPFALQARGVHGRAGVLPRAPVRDDDRRARARLDRRSRSAGSARRPPSAFRTCARSGRTSAWTSSRPARSTRRCGSRPSIPDAVPIQGGTDVMVELNFDRARPEALLNLNEVAELRGWSRENGTLRLGAGLTYAEAMHGDARRGAAGARRGVAHRRLAADPQPRHDRRQPRHRVAGRRRAAAAARRGRRGRGRERARRAADRRSREFLVGVEAERARRRTS